MKKITFLLALACQIAFPFVSNLSGYPGWKAPGANLAALPATGNTAGDARIALDSGYTYYWSGSAWAQSGGYGTLNVQSYSGLIASPADGSYTIDLYSAFASTINTLKIITDSGTATAAVKINSTAVTGISAVSVTSTIATGTASAANTVAAGDKISLVLSSSSSPVNLAFTLKYTR